MTGHGYESYPTLFDRTILWAQKESLLKATTAKGAADEGNSEVGKKPVKNQKAKKQP